MFSKHVSGGAKQLTDSAQLEIMAHSTRGHQGRGHASFGLSPDTEGRGMQEGLLRWESVHKEVHPVPMIRQPCPSASMSPSENWVGLDLLPASVTGFTTGLTKIAQQ